MPDLQPATTSLAALVRGVRDDQLDAPTPCPDYAVGDLLDHIGGMAVAFGAAARKEHGVNAAAPPEGSRANLPADWRDRIPSDLDAMAASWRDGGAWDGDTMIAGMEMPAQVVGTVGLNESVVHGWDLARATGQPFDADADSIEACFGFVEPMSQPGMEAAREPAFGPVHDVPDGATPLDRLIALNGRDPGWGA